MDASQEVVLGDYFPFLGVRVISEFLGMYSLKQYIVEYYLLQRLRSNKISAGGDPQRTGLGNPSAGTVSGAAALLIQSGNAVIQASAQMSPPLRGSP